MEAAASEMCTAAVAGWVGDSGRWKVVDGCAFCRVDGEVPAAMGELQLSVETAAPGCDGVSLSAETAVQCSCCRRAAGRASGAKGPSKVARETTGMTAAHDGREPLPVYYD